MGNKSALNISDFNTIENSAAQTSAPFWEKSKGKKVTAKKVWQQIWKWTKIAIFLFMMLMGLWGCFQSMFDPAVAQNSAIGVGLEFGFPFGTTGDFRFDLQMAAGAYQYNIFTNWSLAHGPFYAFFVWPAAWIITQFMWVTNNWWGGMNTLLAIFLLLLFIRILTIAISLKSTLQTEKMNEIQGQMAEINAKYKDLKDTQSRQMKQQETMALYKKHNVKPFAAFEQMFLTLPIFLIIFRVVTIVRPIKVTVLFNVWNFALSPLNQIFSNFLNGGWPYIFFLLLVAGSQVVSMIIPQRLARKRSRLSTTSSKAGQEQAKKSQRTQLIFMIVMCVIVAFSAVGVGVYWFLNSLFTLAQAAILHKIILNKRMKDKASSARITNFEL